MILLIFILGNCIMERKMDKETYIQKKNDKFIYDGQWANDKYEGFGSLINDGEKYIRFFKNGVRNRK